MTDLPFTRIGFDDVDVFSEWEKELGWDVQSTQLSPRAFRVDFDHVALPELMVSHFRTKGVMQNTFAIPEGMVVFLICRAKLPFVWSGREFAPSVMGICRLRGEQWAVIPDGWDCYEFIASEGLVRRLGIFPASFFAKTTRPEDAYLPLVEPETGQFLTQMDAFFQRFRHANGRPDDAVGIGVFLDYVATGLHRVVDAGLAARGLLPRPTRQADIIPEALEFIRAHLNSAFTADELARVLGVSYRVLNYAFHDACGVSPYQFFLTEKLHNARRKLKACDVSVLEVCTRNGFSTPSRFASQYRRLFGELPSETRKNARRD